MSQINQIKRGIYSLQTINSDTCKNDNTCNIYKLLRMHYIPTQRGRRGAVEETA